MQPLSARLDSIIEVWSSETVLTTKKKKQYKVIVN